MILHCNHSPGTACQSEHTARVKKALNRRLLATLKAMLPILPYRKPQLGRDYWVQDDFLPNAQEIAHRCYGQDYWELGAPYANEPWPGKRTPNALMPSEIEFVETWVKRMTGARRLWQEATPEGTSLNHNYAQLVGMPDSGARPHTDSTKLCRYACVIYLTPDPDPDCGTSFYRQRQPNGTLGGNLCMPPNANLREALRVRDCQLRPGRKMYAWRIASTASCCTRRTWCILRRDTLASTTPTSA